MRHPKILATCLVVAFHERGTGAPDYLRRRESEAPPGTLGAPGITVVSHEIAGPGGPLAVHEYRPAAAGTEPLPVHVLLHGGAFCYGAAADLDALACEHVTSLGGSVVTVDYRLAPEHPWPAAVDDTMAALRWTAQRPGTDVARLTIGGLSAGACIAAACTLRARDGDGPALAGQVLEIPVLDLTQASASVRRFARGRLIRSDHLAECFAHYVPDPDDRTDPDASPLFAADLTGLPPAVVVTAQYDPLRDEGERYATRLRDAGVPVHAIRARGHVHASTYAALPSAQRYRAVTRAALTLLHGGDRCRIEQ